MRHFGPAELTATAWSFSSFAFVDRPLLPAISAASIPRRREFDVQGRASSAWAMSRLQFFDQPGLEAIAAAARPRIKADSSQHIMNLSWALWCLSYAAVAETRNDLSFEIRTR